MLHIPTKRANLANFIIEVSQLTYEDLNAETVNTLRKVYRRLVSVTNKEVTSLRKHELITRIIEAAQPITSLKRKEDALDVIVPDLTSDELQEIDEAASLRCITAETDIPGIAAAVYKEFRKLVTDYYVDGKWQPTDSRLATLAYQALSLLESRHYAPRTLLKYRTVLLDELETLLEGDSEKWFFHQAWEFLTGHSYEDTRSNQERRGRGESCMPSFAKIVMQLWAKTHTKTVVVADKQAVKENQSIRVRVNITERLYQINTLLKKIHTDPESVDVANWYEVSLGLALVTGRRQGELHHSGIFEVEDIFHLRFTGQLKTKGLTKKYFEENPTYIIPTLLASHLVMAGLDWLRNRAGKYYKSLKDVNNNISSPMSKYLKNVGSSQGFEFTNEKGERIVFSQLKYHDLRELYALASYEAEGRIQYKDAMKMEWIAQTLGDGRGTGNAWNTIGLQYMDKFELDPKSTFRV